MLNIQAYGRENKKLSSLLQSSATPFSLVVLLIQVRKTREKREREFQEEKSPHLLQLREIEKREKEYCEILSELEEKISQKLLTMKKESLIIESTLQGEREGEKVTFADITEILPPSQKKIYRDEIAYNTIPDRFFILDVPKGKGAVKGGLALPFFSKEEKTIVKVHTGE